MHCCDNKLFELFLTVNEQAYFFFGTEKSDTAIVLPSKTDFPQRIFRSLPPINRFVVEVAEESQFSVDCHLRSSFLLTLMSISFQVKGRNLFQSLSIQHRRYGIP